MEVAGGVVIVDTVTVYPPLSAFAIPAVPTVLSVPSETISHDGAGFALLSVAPDHLRPRGIARERAFSPRRFAVRSGGSASTATITDSLVVSSGMLRFIASISITGTIVIGNSRITPAAVEVWSQCVC